MLNALRWSASLGAKFFRVVATQTVAVVFFTLVSQVSSLLASLLPLKVVILLGSDGVPRYFPTFLAELNRDLLIAGLSLATLCFFLVHLVSERIVTWVTVLGTSRLLVKSHKMILFENQDQVAAGGYQRYSRALAGGVFIGLAMCGLGWFYPEVAMVIIGYIVVVLLLLSVLHRYNATVREKLETKLRDLLNVVGGIGFFVAFAFLVLDFIVFDPPGVIVAIVTLILSRQIMTRATGLVADLAALNQQRVKLDALFFHGKVLLSSPVQHERTIWPLLQPSARQQWVRAVLEEFSDDDVTDIDCEWLQTGQTNLAALRAITGSRCFLVKFFEKNRSSHALHEATLMGERVSCLPAPRFVGATQVQKFHCLLYELPAGHSAQPAEVKLQVQSVRSELLAIEPPSQLCHRYQRSRPMLWQRLNVDLLERMYMATTSDEQRAMLDSLMENLARLGNKLQVLPLVLHQPDLSQDSLWVTDDATALALNWGRWSLEPLGAGWPEGVGGLQQLASAIIKASESRPALREVAIEDAELSALAFALERECNRQRYVQALELLPRLMGLMNEHNVHFMEQGQ
ncbi:hypothetical protein FZZ93_15210 [Halomonas eurihalina]|uniref:Uncharacterized protein n=1 Tax=Halomonas eurihalina TaxID=42566 RepID=A0A5D9CRZ9_HALER|nr:hypothetical protein [Halomonas eurihalina]MDR5860828.1 hypothetical protein [Halomonas eurihalina]TZG33800.1 hypothetical protein FZZ93_15210 [Halomonas eurihalina]